MGIFGWIVVGLIAGAFARGVTGFNRSQRPGTEIGCFATIAVGVLGGMIGGALTSAATGEKVNDFGLKSIFVAFLGAVLLLLVVQALSTRRR